MKKLLVYIPTFNRLPKLRHCIERLLEEVDGVEADVAIHISDNCSTDGTGEFVHGLDHPCVTRSRNSENIGLPANMLKVHELADRAEVSWIIGDDDVLLGGSIRRLVREITEHPEAKLFFLNTACFQEENKEQILAGLRDNNYCFREPHVPARSKVPRSFNCTHKELINPDIDNLLGGSVMCYAWRSAEVPNQIDPSEVSVDFTQPKACYHVALNYLYGVAPDDPCRHLHDCFTANFWHQGTDWGVKGYELAVTQGLGIIVHEARRLGFIDDADWPKYFAHYLTLARDAYRTILESADDGFATHLANFHPQLAEMFVRDYLCRDDGRRSRSRSRSRSRFSLRKLVRRLTGRK